MYYLIDSVLADWQPLNNAHIFEIFERYKNWANSRKLKLRWEDCEEMCMFFIRNILGGMDGHTQMTDEELSYQLSSLEIMRGLGIAKFIESFYKFVGEDYTYLTEQIEEKEKREEQIRNVRKQEIEAYKSSRW